MSSARSCLLFPLLGALSACHAGAAAPGAHLAGTTASAPTSPTCGPRALRGAPLRRLTSGEYETTVRDLVGVVPREVGAFPPEVRTLGFTNNLDSLTLSDRLVQGYVEAAETIALAISKDDPRRFAGCRAGEDERACARRFVPTFGLRAWRRPLTTAEEGQLGALLERAGSLAAGVRVLVQVTLGSPHFLYRRDGGWTGTPTRANAYEVASRLSYLLWGSMPDEALFHAAGAGALGTPAEIAAQARRMLTDPRARKQVANFHAQLLDLDRADNLDKDNQKFPEWDPAMIPTLREATTRFVDEIVWRPGGAWPDLLREPVAYLDRRMAPLYGLPKPDGAELARVATDPRQRPGFLTQVTFLLSHGHAGQTDPVSRGKFVREQLFCQIPPPPPSNLEIKAPDLDPKLTTRERFEDHVLDVGCKNCHRLMDPIGLAFEGFDTLGRARTTEFDKPVDTSGRLVSTDVDGDFDGVPELTERLARSAQVRRCYVRQWFRFTHGRGDDVADACVIDQLDARFAQSGQNIPALLVALTQTDPFLFRPEVPRAP